MPAASAATFSATAVAPDPAATVPPVVAPVSVAPARSAAVPYRKLTVVVAPLSFTVPFNVADVDVTALAAWVVAEGAAMTVVERWK